MHSFIESFMEQLFFLIIYVLISIILFAGKLIIFLKESSVAIAVTVILS